VSPNEREGGGAGMALGWQEVACSRGVGRCPRLFFKKNIFFVMTSEIVFLYSLYDMIIFCLLLVVKVNIIYYVSVI